MQQYTLGFDRPATVPFTPGSATSKEAADKLRGTVGTIRRRVYDHLFAQGADGATQEECSYALDSATSSSVRTRISELVAAGWVIDSGRTRPNKSGNDARVYIALAAPVTPFRKAMGRWETAVHQAIALLDKRDINGAHLTLVQARDGGEDGMQ